MALFRRKPDPPKAVWSEADKDDMVANLADVACHPEGWRCVCLVAVDTQGGTMIIRHKSEGASGVEMLGAMTTATKLLQRAEVGRFEDD